MSRVARIAAIALFVLVTALAATWAAWRFSVDERPLATNGTIEGRQIDISTKITGRIAELAVREGDVVERGQLLVGLEPEELAAEVRRSEAALNSARAQLRDLEAGPRPEEIREAEARAVRAEAQLNDLLAGSRAQEIEQARAAVSNAAVTREIAERDFRRSRDLYSKEIISAQELDRARQSYEVAAGSEASAREKLALLEAGPRQHEVAAARAELLAAQERARLLRAGPRTDAVAAARAQVEQAQAAYEMARARLAESKLTSPVAGIVMRKNAEAGETVNAGTPIVTLLDPSDLWLRAYVSETDVGRLRLGQAATIRVDAYPNRSFEGRVTMISSAAEYTPRNVQTKNERVNLVFAIKIALSDPSNVLKPGMPADAEIRH